MNLVFCQQLANIGQLRHQWLLSHSTIIFMIVECAVMSATRGRVA